MQLTAFVPERIWLRSYPVRLAGMSFDARMTLVRLASGDLMLHSPGPIDAALISEISALGKVAHIIAPGNYHTSHVAAAQAAFPNAKTWVCPGVERRRPSLRYDGLLGDEAPGAWRGEIEQVLLRGTRIMREVAMFDRASRTLILVDLIENFTDSTPHVGLGMKLIFKTLFRMWNNPRPAPEYQLGWSNRASAAESLRRILEWDFERIIVGHGDLVESNAKAIARSAWRTILAQSRHQ